MIIQSFSDSLYQRAFEGTSGWSKELPGSSAPQKLFWEGSLAANCTTEKRNDPRRRLS